MKFSLLQKLLLTLPGFGLLFVNKNIAFVYLIVLFAIMAFLEFRRKEAK